MIGPETPRDAHAASAPGALLSTRSVGIFACVLPARSLRWRIWKMPAASVTDWRFPPAPIRRPSTVDCIASRPLRASTTVPTGSAAIPFSGTNPEIGAVWAKRVDGTLMNTSPLRTSPVTGFVAPDGAVSQASPTPSTSTRETAGGPAMISVSGEATRLKVMSSTLSASQNPPQ